MAAPGSKRTYQGLRYVQILALDSNGIPAAPDTNAYDGVQLEGANSLVINSPDVQVAVHRGDDRVYQTAILPPTDPLTAVVTASKMNNEVDAVLSDDKNFTVGEWRMMLMNSTTLGNENEVAVLAYSEAQEAGGTAADGSRRYEFRLFPNCTLHRRYPGLAGDALSVTKEYALNAKFVTKHPWGVAFATATEGGTRAQGVEGVAVQKPHIVAFKGDASQKTFVFPTAPAPANTTKIKVWEVSGAVGTLQVITTDYTLSTTTQFVMVTAPADGDYVVAIYEYA
jgi:hypothetical protein